MHTTYPDLDAQARHAATTPDTHKPTRMTGKHVADTAIYAGDDEQGFAHYTHAGL